MFKPKTVSNIPYSLSRDVVSSIRFQVVVLIVSYAFNSLKEFRLLGIGGLLLDQALQGAEAEVVKQKLLADQDPPC